MRTLISWFQTSGTLTILPDVKDLDKERKWVVELVGVRSAEVERRVRDAGFVVEDHGDNDRCGTSFHFTLGGKGQPQTFEIYLGRDLQLDVVDIPDVVEKMLYKCEMGYPDKDTVFKLVTDEDKTGEGVEERVKKLMGLDISREVKDAVMEIWTADSRSEGGARGVVIHEAKIREGGDGGEDVDVRSVDGDMVLVDKVGEVGL